MLRGCDVRNKETVCLSLSSNRVHPHARRYFRVRLEKLLYLAVFLLAILKH